MAEKLDVVEKPRDWEKATAVAYLRLVGLTQIDAAKGAGIGDRTLRRYEISPWWPEACAEAVDRWMQQLEIECRITLLASIKNGDAVAALKVLERLDKRLAPPRLSHGIQHHGEITTGAPDMSDEELIERFGLVVNRIAQVNGASGNGAKTSTKGDS